VRLRHAKHSSSAATLLDELVAHVHASPRLVKGHKRALSSLIGCVYLGNDYREEYKEENDEQKATRTQRHTVPACDRDSVDDRRGSASKITSDEERDDQLTGHASSSGASIIGKSASTHQSSI